MRRSCASRGQIPSDLIGRGFGLLHEIPDQLAILRGLTKWAARINHPTETGKLVNEAFRQLADGRPRPVALEMPLDIMALDSEVALPMREAAAPAAAARSGFDRQGGRAARRGEAADDLCRQRRDGCRRGSAGARREIAGAGHDLYRRQGHRQRPALPGAEPAGRHTNCGAPPMSCWRSAPASTSRRPAGALDGDIKVIRIDLDPVEINRIARPAIGIVADAKEALAALDCRHCRRRSAPRAATNSTS